MCSHTGGRSAPRADQWHTPKAAKAAFFLALGLPPPRRLRRHPPLTGGLLCAGGRTIKKAGGGHFAGGQSRPAFRWPRCPAAQKCLTLKPHQQSAPPSPPTHGGESATVAALAPSRKGQHFVLAYFHILPSCPRHKRKMKRIFLRS